MKTYDFLHSDIDKFVPVQLTKINYGYAPIGGLAAIDEELQPTKLHFTFPGIGWNQPYDPEEGPEGTPLEDVGYSIFLFSHDDTNEMPFLEGVAIGAPGEFEIDITMPARDTNYYIYVMSKNFEDGWIKENEFGQGYGVHGLQIEEAKPFFKRTAGDTDEILRTQNWPLHVNAQLTLSTDESDIDEWYNWQGSYTSPDLIWDGGEVTDGEGGGDPEDFTSSNLLVGDEHMFRYPWFQYLGGGRGGRMVDVILKEEYDASPTETWVSSRWKLLNQEPTQQGILNMSPIYRVWNWKVGADNETGWYSSLSFNLNGGNWEEYMHYGGGVPDGGELVGYVYKPGDQPIDALAIYQHTNDISFAYTESPVGNPFFYAYSLDFTPELGGGGGGTNGVVQENAHLALLQNIRFLKKMLTMVNENLWGSVNNTLARSIEQSQKVINKIDEFQDTNTITSNVETRIPQGSAIVQISELGSENWEVFPDHLVVPSQIVGMLTIDMRAEEYTSPKNYVISIRPKQFRVEIGPISEIGSKEDIINLPTEYPGNDSISDPSFKTLNFFYGWNIEFFNGEGSPLGIIKTIVGSRYNSSGHQFKLSPIVVGGEDLNVNDLTARIWNNNFEAELVQVNIVEHNSETLSYSLYGKRSMDRTNGIMKIYDHNGNVYKTFSMGTLSNDLTDGAIVDYRCNIEDEICFDDEDI